MTSKRVDQILALMGALLAFLSAYQLFFSPSGSYEGVTLGRVSALEKVVKIKRARSLDWVDANALDQVTENQMIYTDNLSRAEVEFTEGSKLSISENSLVRIRSRGKDSELDIDRGNVTTTLAKESPVFVKLNGQDYELRGDGANLQINLHGANASIGVVDGAAEIEQNGVKTSIDEKTALFIEGEKVFTKKLQYVLTLPKRNAQLYTQEDSALVNFGWTGKGEGELVISSTGDFSHKDSYSVVDHSHSLNLAVGKYFWKIEGDEGDSLVSEFRVSKEKAPEILRPKDKAQVDVFVDENGSGSIDLLWASEDKGRFEIEIKDSETRTLISEKESISYSPKEKTLEWRVRYLSEDRPLALWSEYQSVELTYHQYPVIPTELSPHGVEFQSYTEVIEPVQLKWKSAYPVELEISNSVSSETVTVNEKSHHYRPTIQGSHRWRVRGKDAQGRMSDWSPWQEFLIEDLSGEKSSEGIQRIQIKRPDQEITFGWMGQGEGVFEFAKDKEFTQVISKKEVKGDHTKIVVPTTGTYFWRSREYRNDGTLEVSEPRKVIIEPAPAPGKPETLPPMEIPLEYKKNKTSFWDLVLPRAYASDVFGSAKIILPQNENAKFYVLRIFKKGSNEPFIEDTVSGNVFVWESAQPGDYDFQYAVIDYFDRQGPFSDFSPLKVLDAPPAERPRLLSPIRKEEVSEKKVKFRWRKSSDAVEYEFQLFSDEELKKSIFSQMTSKPNVDLKEYIPDGNYYWQVQAVNSSGRKTPSSVGRFVYKTELSKTEVAESPMSWEMKKKRMQISWAPSMDTYEFTDGGQKGTIDGNVLMGLEGKIIFPQEKWNYTGELIRQSGKVFKKEEYSFLKLNFDPGYILLRGKHLLQLGPSLGFMMGQSYGISDSKVSASSVSGAVYGVSARGFHSLSEIWALESKLSYQLGAITELEISGNALRKMKSIYLVFGLGMMSREYSQSSGKQNSLKLNFGFGKEF